MQGGQCSKKLSMVDNRRAWARNPVGLRALDDRTRRAHASWSFHRSRTAWAQDAAGSRWHRVKRHAIQVYPSLPRHPLVANTMESLWVVLENRLPDSRT